MTAQVGAFGHPKSNTRVTALILNVSVDLTKLLSLGKAYFWPRPRSCPKCGTGRMWSHGYALRYFDGLVEQVWMKRFRCPDCGAVHTMRPASHWRGFLASGKVICCSLREKIVRDRWIPQLSRQRQQCWYRGLQIQGTGESAAMGLAEMLGRPLLLATHSLTHREVRTLDYRVHRIFAFTPPSGWP